MNPSHTLEIFRNLKNKEIIDTKHACIDQQNKRECEVTMPKRIIDSFPVNDYVIIKRATCSVVEEGIESLVLEKPIRKLELQVLILNEN